MISPENDGVTHINIYSQGRTELGRFLSNFSDCYVTTEDGLFRTIEGYWYWLGVRPTSSLRDSLRNTSGWESKQLGRKLKGKDWNETPEFQSKILKAICIKILSNPRMVRLLKESNLPLVHYYVYGSKVIEVKDGLWIVSFLEHLRKEIQNGTVHSL